MNKTYLKKVILACLVCLMAFFGLWYVAAGEGLYYQITRSAAPPSPMQSTAELIPTDVIIQPMVFEGKTMESVTVQVNTFGHRCTGVLGVDVFDGETLIGRKYTPLSELSQDGMLTVTFDEPVATPGTPNPIFCVLYTPEAVAGQNIGLYYGNATVLSRGELPKNYLDTEKAVKNQVLMDGALCLQGETMLPRAFGSYFWVLAGAVVLLAGLYGWYLCRCFAVGKSALGLRLLDATVRYRFLAKQLVKRDFKTKYKRSFLGVLWSFLNPLLMMGVQYIVFSTLFKSAIPNFGLYLLIGIVCFNFFSEACSMGLMSILGNAHLITKVYVPKYIYPFTRVLSSCINLGLSLIPIFLAMLLSKVSWTAAILLLPYGLLCLFFISLGMALLLSSLMVFFRDTQFLWGIVNMLWLYLTPIFYPESIIVEELMGLYQLNPLYHILKFTRAILMEGTVPAPETFLYCGLAALLFFGLGALVFKKSQDRFILYI